VTDLGKPEPKKKFEPTQMTMVWFMACIAAVLIVCCLVGGLLLNSALFERAQPQLRHIPTVDVSDAAA
jgi:hypothetical protein